MPSLPTSVTKALGAAPAWLWDDTYSSLHRPALPGSIHDEDEEQTFRMFANMGRREPNERGTGRWLVTESKRTVAILAIGDVNEDVLNCVKKYLTAFLYGMHVEIHSLARGTVKKPKKSSDARLTLGSSTFPVVRKMVDGDDCLEVFSLFDALVHAVEPHHYCMIALAEHGLFEAWDDYDQQVLGRACGDRVCVVDTRFSGRVSDISTNADTKKQLRTLLSTTTHEALHCFGLDHCITWQCLMNSHQVDDHEFLFLSPLNLKKWVHVIKPKDFSNPNVVVDYVVSRYTELSDALRDLGLTADASWADQKLSLVKEVNGRSANATTKRPTKRRKH